MPVTKLNRQGDVRFRFKEPSRYDVVMHNDDFTTMDFVVAVLCKVFRKSPEEAKRLMLKIHHEGSAVAGTYTKDIAESKAKYATDLARSFGFPLRLTVEEVME